MSQLLAAIACILCAFLALYAGSWLIAGGLVIMAIGCAVDMFMQDGSGVLIGFIILFVAVMLSTFVYFVTGGVVII